MASIGDFDPLNASIPATKVEITVSFCVLYTQGMGNKEWREYGRTEVIDNTLNPDFVRKFMLDYFFEERQNLRFDLFILFCVGSPPISQDFLGQACCTLGEVVGSVGSRLEKPLGGIQGKKCGTIIVKAEELNNCRESVMMQFCGNKLDKKDFFGKSDPFLVFYRSNEDGTFTICHKTEVVKNTLNPVWQAFKIPVRALCNGNPAQPTSLHYMSPYQLNAYAMALKAVGEIIQDYDSDKMFPALGFGAKLPPDGRVSHEFALNGNPQNPYCTGIDGVMEAYYQSLKSVQLYGPTNFSPVINHVARYAASVKDGSQYFVLLIITDGVISDMAQTKESIVNAASLPMSIIIVGVGPAEFDAMVELDGDEVRISSRGRFAERDIVQFVPFRDYIDRTGNHILSMARLAKDVLAEIPDQFLSYMRTRGIKPSPAPPPYSPPSQPIQTQI
uniref:Copine 8 n=1 Tax=Nothobranchius furzeri TaxID=105023 RepID=A0A8C6L1Y4_NOTFU